MFATEYECSKCREVFNGESHERFSRKDYVLARVLNGSDPDAPLVVLHDCGSDFGGFGVANLIGTGPQGED
jgi:hypothetical protein